MSNNYYYSASDPGGNMEGNPSLTVQDVGNSLSSLNNRTTIKFGEIKHTSKLFDQISSLYLNDDCSDLTLIVEDQRFSVHRVILAARSTYFHAMLFCGMRETNENEITLSILKNKNACAIFTVAQHYSIDYLMDACLDFIDNCAAELLETQEFIDLPSQALIEILRRNSFCAPEIEIFNAVKRWIESHPEENSAFPLILAQIRLSLIKVNDLFENVRESNLISPDQILDAIKDQNTLSSSQLKYRGFLNPEVNIATINYGTKVISGDFRTALLVNQNKNDGLVPPEKTFSKHLINPKDSGITIELGRPFIINCIEFQLMDRDQRAFSYYIEVSIDKSDWVRVIDHTLYLCRSRQQLLFESRVVKFIRIFGTHCTVNNTFQLCNFEAYFTGMIHKIDKKTTLQIPNFNVASIDNYAIVTEGVSRSRNALLNGDIKNYDWDNGYTCHQLGSGALVVQLPQPYLIKTMRFLLWDCDDRCYSFYVEVSVDQLKWTKVAEFNECKSWQVAQFEQLPVVFIRIVGTYNSANEVFHCVHFECPAMDINEENEEERKKKIKNVKDSVTDYSFRASTSNISNNERINSNKHEKTKIVLDISSEDDTIYEVIDEEYREENEENKEQKEDEQMEEKEDEELFSDKEIEDD